MKDLAEIGFESHFAYSIGKYFEGNRPEIIIETGLYHGKGSTFIIAALIRGLRMEESEFYSIECNKENIETAKNNLTEEGLMDYVEIEEGLSIPKEMLPNHQTICESIREAKKRGMFVDHEVSDYSFYNKETSNFSSDNVLGKLLDRFKGKADFILLDSAGHIGNIEFNYLIKNLKNTCAIALDDTKHLKHYKSLETIKSDSRFTIIHESEDKFGSVLSIFNP